MSILYTFRGYMRVENYGVLCKLGIRVVSTLSQAPFSRKVESLMPREYSSTSACEKKSSHDISSASLTLRGQFW
eukprot:snap_masked-scaffold_1-processed-gene-28.5-mRNA-1 protein AED:1.00 eAED:1.00 QI:0/0/0/0/1/1/2/0/73